MKKVTILSALSIAIMFSSCSVEKRVYMKGFHVEWKKRSAETQNISAANKEIRPEVLQPQESTIVPEPAQDLDNTIIACADVTIVLPETIKPTKKLPECRPGRRTANIPVVVEEKKVVKEAPQVKHGISANRFVDDVRPHGLAIASLVLGILALVAYYGAFPLGVLAIVFGFIALRRINDNPTLYRGRGIALAGIICGFIALAIITTALLLI